MKEDSYRRYLLGVMLTIFAFNYVDRLALGLVLQSIKIDLALTDTQLGLLSGIAFALFYSVMGIPLARWADRGNRVTIVTVTTALWSLATAFCGAAANFLQLMLIRVGIAVGEAGCFPVANSLIADYFTRAERPRAMAIYMLGVPLASMIGYFLAGWLNQLYGWRVMFVLLGLPGLVLAVLVRFTLKEPRRNRGLTETLTSPTQLALKEAFITLWANATFRHLLLAYSILVFFSAGSWKWQPTFFVRSHDLRTAELGMWLALIYGVGGFLGTYLGGELASRRAAGNEALQLRGIALACCFFGAISALGYLSSSKYPAFALMGVAAVGLGMINGPFFATIQAVVPQRTRALSIAILYLFANLIGLGMGPLAAGIMSDALRPLMGEEALRYALLSLCPGYLWSAWHLWRAGNSVAQDVVRAQANEMESVKCAT